MKLPSSPLPFAFDDARGVIHTNNGLHVANLTVRSGDADGPYLANAANAYPKLVEALKKNHAENVETIKAVGGCDHSVGICACDLIRMNEETAALLKELEP